jgi:hypothetical protein
MEDDKKLSEEEIRAALIAKITAAWPDWQNNDDLSKSIDLASNDDLRKYLALAEVAREIAAGLQPVSGGISDERRQSSASDANDAASPTKSPNSNEQPQYVAIGSVNGKGFSEEDPTHTYVFAIDYDLGYTGPRWIPFNLFSQAQGYGFGSRNSSIHLSGACARKLIDAAGAESLWAAIGKQYRGKGLPDYIAETLPARCAEYLHRWQAIPKLTPGEYREKRESLARRAEQLAKEVDIFYADAHIEDGEGFSFMRLLSEEEKSDAYTRIRYHNHVLRNSALKDAGVRGKDWNEYSSDFDPSCPLSAWNPSPAASDAAHTWEIIDVIVPALPEMLNRLAMAFRADADKAPLSRPNIANAERNYFTRELCAYFWRECGDASPSIIADIVNIFFAQGISENEVSQIIRKVKSTHPLPADPDGHESSPDK